MATHIVLPDSVKTFQCQIPGCEEHFYSQRAYERHVPICARKHRETLIALSDEHAAEVDADPFQRVWDPEALEWIQQRRREGSLGYS